MPTLYLSEQHSIVRKEGDCLVVQPQRNGEGEVQKKVRVPLIKVDHVVVEGDVTLTTPALYALLDNHIEVSYLSFYGNFKGSLSPGFSKNSLLRVAQHQAHNDSHRRLILAKRFVSGKLANMRTLLMRYRRKDGQEELDRLIGTIEEALSQVPKTSALRLDFPDTAFAIPVPTALIPRTPVHASPRCFQVVLRSTILGVTESPTKWLVWGDRL